MVAFFTASYHQLASKTPLEVPRASFGRVWLSLPHLVSDVSDPQLNWGPRGPPAWRGPPYHTSSLTPTVWLLVLTELYNSSTPTQSPTQSLEWHVWSSSSGNNCHAVHRSLSSGASVYEWTVGFFTLSHFISQIRLGDLFRLLAIGMWHFLPVHHFGMARLPGPKVKIQQKDIFCMYKNSLYKRVTMWERKCVHILKFTYLLLIPYHLG